MNESESEIEHIRRVRLAMTSGSRSRASMTARADAEVRSRLEASPEGTDAFEVANNLQYPLCQYGKIAVWNMYQAGELAVTEDHRYVLNPELIDV